MAAPPLGDVLDAVAASGAAQVIVQPHLLFGGVLLDRLGQVVAGYAERYPRICWQSAAHLGPAQQVATAIAGRAAESLAASQSL